MSSFYVGPPLHPALFCCGGGEPRPPAPQLGGRHGPVLRRPEVLHQEFLWGSRGGKAKSAELLRRALLSNFPAKVRNGKNSKQIVAAAAVVVAVVTAVAVAAVADVIVSIACVVVVVAFLAIVVVAAAGVVAAVVVFVVAVAVVVMTAAAVVVTVSAVVVLIIIVAFALVR